MNLSKEFSEPLADFWNKNCWMILIIIGCVVMAYASVLVLGKNNPVELEVEKVIEQETGVRVDLTP